MAYLKDLEPNLYDRVKHRFQKEGCGIVIAKYKIDDEQMLDVLSFDDDDHIWYVTPATNWEVTELNDDQEE